MNVWLNEIWRAWRASLRRPGFLLLAVCVLGLGVGASTGVFTLVNQVLLRPLPFSQPGRLVVMGADFGGGAPIASPALYQHLQSLQGVESAGFVRENAWPTNILGNGAPRQVRALFVDRHLLPTLGVHMVLGRNFTVREDQPHGPPVVILGHGLWERGYGGNPDVIGEQMEVKGVPHTIVGVLPARFEQFCKRYFHGCAIVLPMALPAGSTAESFQNYAVARLAPGATVRAVQAQVQARARRLYAASTDSWMKGRKFAVMSLSTALHQYRKSTLLLFMASALFVLLIAWANLTNLLFLRTLSRHHDGAIREALGAAGLRRHLPAFAESLLVGLLGTLLGVALAVAGLGGFRHFAPAAWLAGNGLHMNASTWLFALVASVLGAMLATVLGLWKGRRAALGISLHEGGRSGAGPRMSHLGRVLVVVQVALATVLLSGAGLFLHALFSASQVQLGFNPNGVLTYQLTPLETKYPDADAILALGQRIRHRLATQPGVTHVVVSTALPTGDYMKVGGFSVDGGKTFAPQYAGVGVNYFITFAIPVIRGRVFDRADQRGSEPVAVVNEAFARKHFGGDALGKTLAGTNPKPVSLRVVGVVGDTRQAGPLRPAPPIVYVPLRQVPASLLEGSAIHFAVRVHGDPVHYRKAVRAVMTEVAPVQPIAKVRTVRSMVADTVSHVLLILLLVGLFAVLALLLASAGIYAVMAVVVASREHEFGVRSALGASPANLTRQVLRGGLLQVGIGLAAGVFVAALLSGTLHALLTQIGRSSAFDPWAIVSVCVLLAIAGLLACLRPALRAGHVQPMHALRGE